MNLIHELLSSFPACESGHSDLDDMSIARLHERQQRPVVCFRRTAASVLSFSQISRWQGRLVRTNSLAGEGTA